MIDETAKKDASVGSDSPPTPPLVKATIMSLFPTSLYRCETGPVHLNEELEALTRQLMSDSRNAVERTNAGGWHYAFDVFLLQEPVIAAFRNIMEQHVQ